MSAAARHRPVRDLLTSLIGALLTTGSGIDFPVFTFPLVQPSFINAGIKLVNDWWYLSSTLLSLRSFGPLRKHSL